jgi:hypothetical protein
LRALAPSRALVDDGGRSTGVESRAYVGRTPVAGRATP